MNGPGRRPFPELIIFDCDGVLVDSEPIAAATLAGELTRLGFATTTEACLDAYTGLSMADVMSRIEDAWGRRLPSNFRQRLEQLDYAAFRRELKTMPGIEAVLAALDRPKCVASSGSLEKLDLTLSVTGLMDYFAPHVFSAEQVANGKPAADLFLFAAAAMGVRPAGCVVVEDSVAGVTAAIAAGMRVVGFSGGGPAGEGDGGQLEQAGASAVATRPGDLLRLLLQ